MRPEWAPQDAVLLAWPHAHTDWADYLNDVQNCYIKIIRQLLEDSRVLLLSPDKETSAHLNKIVNHVQLTTFELAYDDTWARDFGPLAIDTAKGPRLLDFQFNAWGDKYNSTQDNRINQALYNAGVLLSRPTSIDFILEGGSIESDGQGTLLTTERCLLSSSRNQRDRTAIETDLKQHLNASRVLWLSHGALLGDDTDAHIDTLARFADAQTIIYMSCDRPDDPHYDELNAMEEELRQLKQTNGASYRLLPIPLPQPIYRDDQPLPASYVNFLITNQQVLVPTYQDDNDAIAVRTIAAAFPQHRVTGIDCRALIHQYGSLHCITMQLPQHSVTPLT